LFQADVHLTRARLFHRASPYPWQSAPDDLARARDLIQSCGYHRRNEELADAEAAIARAAGSRAVARSPDRDTPTTEGLQ
jgi:hypothetical protein